ncbi:hypothetical protein OHA37_02395 [Streptomyces sp. NBC_00335]|uniref:hypothetical protein n=1 Tax=unclassified Streptomyces TaxID=2593676 RepID=UPI0022549B68|nr:MULTISPECIES: hypothetical protein [unclassified Streptomyces]MCX5402733.1 hypothetical protein [Streptomyces sp. NBC_00086]
MNDPITLAATEYEEPRRLPDPTDVRPPAPGTDGLDFGPEPEPESGPQSLPQSGAQSGPRSGTAPEAQAGHGAGAAPGPDPGPRPAGATARTVLETAATGRPVREVTDLVNLLKESGQVPNPGHAALRAAAVARPVHEVREMVTLLGEPPHERVETDITLRAAALGRPIEDVALLVSILGTGEQPPQSRPEPAERERTPVRPPAPQPQAQAPARGPSQTPARGAARPGKGALRHILRWPVAFALLLCGALHVPGDLAALGSGDPGGLLALAVTLLCLTAGALLAVRDTAGAWRAGAVVALGVAGLHVAGGVAGFDPLGGAVGGSLEWAGITAVLSAAAGAVLAGLALQYRPAADPADGA